MYNKVGVNMKGLKFAWKPEYKFLLVLGLFLCLCLINTSYSFYKETKENKDAVYLEGVELVYTITSSSLSNNQIVLAENSKETITIQVESKNAKDTEYEVYYQIVESLSQEEKEKISVVCYENISESLPTGEISASGVKTIVVEIENNNTSPVTIELGCQGGLVGRELVLEQGNKIPVTIAIRELVEMIKPEAVLDNIQSTYVTNSTGIDFSQISSDTNGKGLYILHGTENNQYPIMYYRGDVKNNNVKFANFCWKIVRTTETGGVKLIYNGIPDNNGQCTAIGASAAIGNSKYSSSYGDNTYLGYMFGMVGSSSYELTHRNRYDSTIKGKIDSWYEENMTSYTEKLEDTAWCNDRSVVPDSSYPGAGTGVSKSSYGARNRLYNNKIPTLECVNENDRFTVSSENGNGALTYPIALLTADEIVYAGAVNSKSNSSYYLNNGDWWWTMSPFYFLGSYAHAFHVNASGDLIYNSSINYEYGIRPSISLKQGTKVESGEGTMENPYVIVE